MIGNGNNLNNGNIGMRKQHSFVKTQHPYFRNNGNVDELLNKENINRFERKNAREKDEINFEKQNVTRNEIPSKEKEVAFKGLSIPIPEFYKNKIGSGLKILGAITLGIGIIKCIPDKVFSKIKSSFSSIAKFFKKEKSEEQFKGTPFCGLSPNGKKYVIGNQLLRPEK